MHTERQIPARAGAGLKAAHYAEILDGLPDVGFFEVHAENCMGEGGPPHRYLEAIRARYPLSVHGVGLSIGSTEPLDPVHLQRLRRVVDRYEPGLVSEHLAWSSHGGVYFNDLLPLPYTPETLERVCRHIDQVQATLRRQILLENPSAYIRFDGDALTETEFLAAVAARTGCALLLDVNNVMVSCSNRAQDAGAYLDAFPLRYVQQIHLAGYSEQPQEGTRGLLIDDHGSPVRAAVWDLYVRVIAEAGPTATLIEWDNNLPAWRELYAEVERADRVLDAVSAAPASARRPGAAHAG